MKLEPDFRAQIELLFQPLRSSAAAKAFPAPASLSDALMQLLPRQHTTPHIISLSPKSSVLFATAAVDMWLRAVHSFLVSASLLDASPIWASTAGYYSSHYSVRSLAHLLGFFQLHHRRRKVQLQIVKQRVTCTYHAKGGGDREHQFYWRALKSTPAFSNDSFFTSNEGPAGEAAHRDRANYTDHIGLMRNFTPIQLEQLKQRIDQISQMQFSTAPIPKMDHFPDVDSVQVIAYHRIVRFRQLLDEVLGGKNRFWTIHRNPPWVKGLLDFQITEQAAMNFLIS